MLMIIWLVLTVITVIIAVYKLNVSTRNICFYIEQHYPLEYQHCQNLSSQVGQEEKNTSLFVMDSFHSGQLAHHNDPALEQFRQQLTRLKILFILSPTLIFFSIIVTTHW